jgi:hypothetical protein
MKTLASSLGNYLPLIVIGGVLLFFGVLILVIILIKKHFSGLQIKKDDIDEKTAVQQELDRILVPIDDEDIKKEMENASKAVEEDKTKSEDAKKD